MEYLKEYRETLEQVENLDEMEGIKFMWQLDELLDQAFEQAPAEEKPVYAKFYPVLEDSDDAHELADLTEDLHTEFYSHGSEKAEYVQDVVTGLYQEALERI